MMVMLILMDIFSRLRSKPVDASDACNPPVSPDRQAGRAHDRGEPIETTGGHEL
jgi:hypothetical protein